jgi:hypothetical protein
MKQSTQPGPIQDTLSRLPLHVQPPSLAIVIVALYHPLPFLTTAAAAEAESGCSHQIVAPHHPLPFLTSTTAAEVESGCSHHH